MSKINPTLLKLKPKLVTEPPKPGDEHLNYEGGPSYFRSNPVATLQMIAASSFFGEPQYYAREKGEETAVTRRDISYLSARDVDVRRAKLNALDPGEWRNMTPKEAMEDAIDKALDFSIDDTLKLAVQLRRDWHIRVTPQVILVRAANHKSIKGKAYKIIGEYAPLILERTDDAVTGLAYQLATYGRKAIPNSLKRAWGKYLSGLNEYSLAKYRLESHEVKLVDLVNLTHPRSEAIDKLMKGTLKLEEDRETWESLISREGSSEETWRKALGVMGHMALLRNLRNLQSHGVGPEYWGDRLVDGAETGKQLPFRYVAAAVAMSGGELPLAYHLLAGDKAEELGYIEKALTASMPNMTHFVGRTMSLCDNSGSAHGTTTSSMGSMQISTIANLSALLTGYNSDEGYVGVFGDRLAYYEVEKNKSIFSQLREIEQLGKGVGGGTETGIWLFWRDAIGQRIWWDTVFIYSDQQAGHGGLYAEDSTMPPQYVTGRSYGSSKYVSVPDLVNDYRKAVNPNVNVFSIQVAGYRDTILPEFYDRFYIVGGWGDGVLRFADEMIRGRNLLTGGQNGQND